ncbi:zinc transporter ZntB [Rhodalgimonas zhirmunskyi]|uniref:Zinc transporter ZntB n=1 Tax=Rhodalgimonas zhirmunskyi TaxID=2964767 RepID=A0AAJ1U945_9RHOB|nr:zinc transporter ZntB [Rhodoalgimonas zhirmunskyi]MDQ2095596.1 zinc transporter ZntB [Rhodoalgimonas zhirmunskyi]
MTGRIEIGNDRSGSAHMIDEAGQLITSMQAFHLDGAGGMTAIEVPAGMADLPGDGFNWVHILGRSDEIDAWLRGSGIDLISLAALTAEETAPRATAQGQTILVNLRGVNLSPGAEPEDMVSIRMFISERLVISLQRRPLYAVRDVIRDGEGGHGAVSPGELVARIALRLAERAEPVVMALNERVDELEDQVIEENSSVQRGDLADIRRMAIMMRRYMFPQRDALNRFELEEMDWLHGLGRSRLREAAERMTRLAEELDSIRDRAQIVRDEVMDLRGEAMNRQMLVLSVVTAVFLPLGLITGLLGINVGGIPGASVGWAFWGVVGVLIVLAVIQFWVFWKIGLIRRG